MGIDSPDEINEGDHSNYIYLINKGAVKCFRMDEQGKELITALYKEDDLFGYTSFTQNIPYQETATAIKDLEMVGILKNDLKNLLDTNHKVALELMQLLTEDLTGIKDQLLQMAYSSVNKKTATTILKFAEKLNRKPEDPIKISRNDLASVAGIATETLIRTLSRFKKEGIHSNAMMGSQKVKEVCQINPAGKVLLKTAMERLGLSARAYDRILKVSRTIADLAGTDEIQIEHLAEAIQYRSLDRDSWAG